MRVLYLIFVQPFETLFSALFNVSYAVTQNYGISLIGLSLLVSVLLFPLFYLAELWKRKEQAVQLQMKGRLDIIKKYYSGSRRHYLTVETQKLYGYKSIYAFRTSLGLLIQIPIFLAAYSLLTKYTGFAGVPFLFIRDLSKPDGLLFGLHLLPILMTAVNIVSSIQYVKMTSPNGLRGSGKEMAQLGVFALLFLILLYNSPSALVIYWTCNNLFGIVKNVLFSRMKSLNVLVVPGEADTAEKRAAAPALPAWFGKLARALYVSLTGTALVSAGLACIWIQRHLPASTRLNVMAEFIALLLSLPVFLYSVKKIAARGFPVSVTVKKCCLLALPYVPPVLLSLYIFATHRMGEFGVFHILMYGLFLLANASVLLYIRGREWINSILKRFFSGREKAFFLLSVSLTALLFFFYYPSSVYVSDSSYFSQSLLWIMLNMLPACLIYVGLAVLLYRVLSSFYKRILVFALFVLLSFVVLNTFVFQGGYGGLDLQILENPDYLSGMRALLLDMMCSFCVITFCVFLYYYRFAKQVVVVCTILSVSIAFLTVYNTVSVQLTAAEKNASRSAHTEQDIERFYSLSGTEKNVVVLVFDMFTGSNMREVLEKNPDLMEGLSGFVWYPDTLASSDYTIAGLPPIYGGADFTAESINQRKGIPQEEMNVSYTRLPNFFAGEGYDVALNTPSDFLGPAFFNDHLTNPESVFLFDPHEASLFLLNAEARQGQILRYAPYFMALSLFKCVPHLVKPYICGRDVAWYCGRCSKI